MISFTSKSLFDTWFFRSLFSLIYLLNCSFSCNSLFLSCSSIYLSFSLTRSLKCSVSFLLRSHSLTMLSLSPYIYYNFCFDFSWLSLYSVIFCSNSVYILVSFSIMLVMACLLLTSMSVISSLFYLYFWAYEVISFRLWESSSIS